MTAKPNRTSLPDVGVCAARLVLRAAQWYARSLKAFQEADSHINSFFFEKENAAKTLHQAAVMYGDTAKYHEQIMYQYRMQEKERTGK